MEAEAVVGWLPVEQYKGQAMLLQTVFTIPHGLSPIPELYWAEAASDDAISNRRTTVTSTDIVVTYAVPPPAGGSNLTFHWAAGYINPRFQWVYAMSTTEITNKTIGDHLDFKRVATPANPSVDVGRMYHRQIDSNNDGMFVKLKKAGSQLWRFVFCNGNTMDIRRYIYLCIWLIPNPL